MPAVTLTIHAADEIVADVLTTSDGRHWIVLRVGGLVVHLADWNAACATQARQIAAALVARADALDLLLATTTTRPQ